MSGDNARNGSGIGAEGASDLASVTAASACCAAIDALVAVGIAAAVGAGRGLAANIGVAAFGISFIVAFGALAMCRAAGETDRAMEEMRRDFI